MIRRRAGNEFHLIAQPDHARLSATLAARFGNALYAPPTRPAETVAAANVHDEGWRPHDAAPSLNAAGLPLDVFEAGIALETTVWEDSAARAEAAGPYAGLLVSLHGQRLAAHANRRPTLDNRERFWLIRFGNDQAERQVRLRETLGLRTDRALSAGLPVPHGDGDDDPREQALAYDLRILQACDLLSLCACCDTPPAWTLAPLPRRPAGASLPAAVTRPADGRLVVHPWPFDAATVLLDVPYRPVPDRPYADAADLARALADAPRRTFPVVVEARHSGF